MRAHELVAATEWISMHGHHVVADPSTDLSFSFLDLIQWRFGVASRMNDSNSLARRSSRVAFNGFATKQCGFSHYSILTIAVASCRSKFHILTNFAKWTINWFLNGYSSGLANARRVYSTYRESSYVFRVFCVRFPSVLRPPDLHRFSSRRLF